MKIIILILLPAVLLAQNFRTNQYICTTGADSIYRGSFNIGLYANHFMVKSFDEIITVKKITHKKKNKYYFDGGYIRKSYLLDGTLNAFWMVDKKCKKTYYYRKDW